MLRRQKQVTRSLCFSLLCAAVITVLTLSLLASLDNQRHYASMLNFSGKQRMLTQRIVYLTQNIVAIHNTSTKHSSEQELRDSLDELRSIHKNLRAQIIAYGPNLSLYSLYFGDLNLDQRLNDFIQLGFEFLHNPHTDQRIDLAEQLWLKWGGDNAFKKEQLGAMQEGLYGLIEVATFNIQILSDTHITSIQNILMWAATGISLFMIAVPLLTSILK